MNQFIFVLLLALCLAQESYEVGKRTVETQESPNFIVTGSVPWRDKFDAVTYAENQENHLKCREDEIMCSKIKCVYPRPGWYISNWYDRCHEIHTPRCWKKEECELDISDTEHNKINWEKKMKCEKHEDFKGMVLTNLGDVFPPKGADRGVVSEVDRTFEGNVNLCGKLRIRNVDIHEVVLQLSKRVEELENKIKLF